MADAINALIDRGLAMEWNTLPARSQSHLKSLILDTLAAGVSGSVGDTALAVRQSLGAGAGRTEGHVHTWGGGTGRADDAAFVNAYQAHAESFDAVEDTHDFEPLAPVLAATMAAAEAQGQVSGKVFGSGLAAGLDLALHLVSGTASSPRFYRPASASLFGATLGVCRLREMDAASTRRALSYALSLASGALQGREEGTPATAVQSGHTARTALLAAELGANGVDGPLHILDGQGGYFASFEGQPGPLIPEQDAEGPGERLLALNARALPTARQVQPGLVLMRRLHDRGILSAHVASLTLIAPPGVQRLIARPWKPSMSPDYARFCFQYCGAMMLLHGEVGLHDFAPEAINAPDASRLAGRIRVESDGRNDGAALMPQTLRLQAAVGGDIEETIEAWPDAPFSNGHDVDEHHKLRLCLSRCFDEDRAHRIADRLVHHVGNLEWLEDVSVISWLAAGKGDIP